MIDKQIEYWAHMLDDIQHIDEASSTTPEQWLLNQLENEKTVVSLIENALDQQKDRLCIKKIYDVLAVYRSTKPNVFVMYLSFATEDYIVQDYVPFKVVDDNNQFALSLDGITGSFKNDSARRKISKICAACKSSEIWPRFHANSSIDQSFDDDIKKEISLDDLNQTLYHMTFRHNVEKIVKNGFKASSVMGKDSVISYRPRVYFWNNVDWHYGGFKTMVYQLSEALRDSSDKIKLDKDDLKFGYVFQVDVEKLKKSKAYKDGKMKFYIDTEIDGTEDVENPTAVFTEADVPLKFFKREIIEVTMDLDLKNDYYPKGDYGEVVRKLQF